MMLHIYIPNQCSYQVSTSYALQFLRYSLDKIGPATHLPACPYVRHAWKQYRYSF